MNIIEAVKTKLPMKRPHHSGLIHATDFGDRYLIQDDCSNQWYDYKFTEDDFLAEDWEVEE